MSGQNIPLNATRKMIKPAIVLAAALSVPSISSAADVVDANAYGFLPDAEPSANAAAFQKALDGGMRKVVVSRPGVYGLDRTVFIDSDTEIEFASGVTLQKRAKYSNMLVNRGAYNFTSNANIAVRGLRLSINGFQMIPPRSSPAKNLRGQLAFYHVRNVRVYDFKCLDLGNWQYCVHFVGFEDVLVDGFEIRGLKDGVHFNAGRGFTVRNGILCTCDDGLAVNAGDWPDCAPEMGSLVDGLFENITFLPTGPEHVKKPGELARIDASSWPDWHPGIRLQRNDTVRVGRRVYAVSPMPFSTNEIVSLACPTHTNGVWQSPEGINFLYLQDNGVNRCDARNIVFRNIVNKHPKGILLTWETGNAWCRAIHPEISPADYPVIDVTVENLVSSVPGRPALFGTAHANVILKNVVSAGPLVAFSQRRGTHGPYAGMRGRIVCEDCAFDGAERADFVVRGDCTVDIEVKDVRQTRPVRVECERASNVTVSGDVRVDRVVK